MLGIFFFKEMKKMFAYHFVIEQEHVKEVHSTTVFTHMNNYQVMYFSFALIKLVIAPRNLILINCFSANV